MKRSFGPQDEDYVPEEEVYEHYELNVLINFYSCSIANDPLHSFLRISLYVEVLKIYFLLRMKQLLQHWSKNLVRESLSGTGGYGP
jgi:hypothetical protein